MNHLAHLIPLVSIHEILPLQANLTERSPGADFVYMFGLGKQYLKAEAWHLLFLVTLLLPATLVVNRNGKNWGGFGGIGYSLVHIVRIVTAFTIGYSITLFIGAIGIVRIPTGLIEILIALSIFISAIHACKPIFRGKEVLIAAGFGLIHGLAFAQTLLNLNLDAGRMALSILGFNLGIQVIQLFIIGIALPWLIMLSYNNFYTGLRIAGALIAAVASLGWMVERLTGTPNFVGSTVMAASGYTFWLLLVLGIAAIMSFFVRFERTPAT